MIPSTSWGFLGLRPAIDFRGQGNATEDNASWTVSWPLHIKFLSDDLINSDAAPPTKKWQQPYGFC